MTQTTQQDTQRHVTLRFHEIALKGRNRPFFIDMLLSNVRRAVRGLDVLNVSRGPTMVGISLGPRAEWDTVKRRLSQVFGVVKFALAFRVPASLAAVEKTIEQELPRLQFKSFRISAHRTDKRSTLTSVDINRRLGAFVQARTGAAVNLTHPDLDIRVDILPREALVYFQKEAGPGGLPVGTGGKVACLMSAGIDSPVAAYHLMKRGCRVIFVHFHSFPLVEGRSREKAVELLELLTQYQYDSRLYLVPFADLQRTVVLSVPGPYRVVTYRRFMARIAQAIAQREGAKALVTGESLGQVASQTLENLITIEEAVAIPVLRPLIGMDKQEIVAQAKAIGTFETSIQPDEDCCTLFVPKHPATHTTIDTMRNLETELDVDGLVEQAIATAEVREFSV